MPSDTFKSYHANLECVLGVLFAITYGFVVILIYTNRKFSESDYFTLFIGLWTVALNSMMVFLPSKLHSISKQSVTQMWRLLLANIDFQDLRVRHLRLIMLEQFKDI